jgi:hypothetical protein
MSGPNQTTMVSSKERKAILRLVELDCKRRPPEVLAKNAQRADTAVSRLVKSRRDAKRWNEHLLELKASV